MRLYIPNIGDFLVLTEDWSFDLLDERRNDSLYKLFGGNPSTDYHRSGSITGTLPKNTVLKVVRIYIRTRKENYNSISFVVKKAPFSFTGKLRFWVKLEETRKIEFEIYDEK